MATRIIKFTPMFSVEISDPYSEAVDDLGPFEAEVLNQARANLIKKHFLKYVKALDTVGELDILGAAAMGATINEFAGEYDFGDHSKKVATEARKLAKIHVVNGIRAAGYVLSQVTKDNLVDMVDKVLRDNDRYIAEAKELVPVGEQLPLLEYAGETEE